MNDSEDESQSSFIPTLSSNGGRLATCCISEVHARGYRFGRDYPADGCERLQIVNGEIDVVTLSGDRVKGPDCVTYGLS